MAYDRYDSRDERPRFYNDRYSARSGGRDRYGDRHSEERGRGRSEGDERGFFERAGDEIASWFGDEDSERGRHDQPMEGRSGRDRGDYAQDRSRGSPDYRTDSSRERERGYRPMAGDYGRGHHESDQFFAASGYGRGEQYAGDREPSRSSSRDRGDPHYQSLRQRHMDELDRDYEDYRRENQSRFESEFGSWRQQRMQKRSLLGRIREHMEVVGSDDEHVGTVDRIARDRIILAKSDPESGGAHHSLSCSEIASVEDDRVILDCSADQARERWRDESRSRALFERDDQGEMGPRVLDRSFQGTYRD
jgi:hypothetical protein